MTEGYRSKEELDRLNNEIIDQRVRDFEKALEAKMKAIRERDWRESMVEHYMSEFERGKSNFSPEDYERARRKLHNSLWELYDIRGS